MKLKEIADKYKLTLHPWDTGHAEWDETGIELAMKKYAEMYLEKFKNASKNYFWSDDHGQILISEYEFDKIPTPTHEI